LKWTKLEQRKEAVSKLRKNIELCREYKRNIAITPSEILQQDRKGLHKYYDNYISQSEKKIKTYEKEMENFKTPNFMLIVLVSLILMLVSYCFLYGFGITGLVTEKTTYTHP